VVPRCPGFAASGVQNVMLRAATNPAATGSRHNRRAKPARLTVLRRTFNGPLICRSAFTTWSSNVRVSSCPAFDTCANT
jgi:hypothetical protein